MWRVTACCDDEHDDLRRTGVYVCVCVFDVGEGVCQILSGMTDVRACVLLFPVMEELRWI